jgi:hypothetical protein
MHSDPGRRDTQNSRFPRVRNVILLSVLLIALSGCTSVGMHTKERSAVDYGPPAKMRVCALRTEDVSEQRVNDLIEAVNKEFSAYSIEVTVPWIRPWTRPGFTVYGIFDDLARRDLEPPCDRLVAFVDRHFGDFMWGLVLPEVLGAVDDDTHTHGYVVANSVTSGQAYVPPKDATIHEFYHLLGCPHSATLRRCYGRIADLKRGLDPNADFLPGVARDGSLLLTREVANTTLRDAVAKEDEKRQAAKVRPGKQSAQRRSNP